MPKRSKMQKSMKPSAKQIAKHVFKTSLWEFWKGFTAITDNFMKWMKKSQKKGYKVWKRMKRNIKKIFRNKK